MITLPLRQEKGTEASAARKPPELFSAAGRQFEFSGKTLQPLAKVLREELKRLCQEVLFEEMDNAV